MILFVADQVPDGGRRHHDFQRDNAPCPSARVEQRLTDRLPSSTSYSGVADLRLAAPGKMSMSG